MLLAHGETGTADHRPHQRDVLPALLREAGVDEAQVTAMLVENPRFCFGDGTR